MATKITPEKERVVVTNILSPIEAKITDGENILDLSDLKHLEAKELLQLILVELRKINIHMQAITDEEV